MRLSQCCTWSQTRVEGIDWSATWKVLTRWLLTAKNNIHLGQYKSPRAILLIRASHPWACNARPGATVRRPQDDYTLGGHLVNEHCMSQLAVTWMLPEMCCEIYKLRQFKQEFFWTDLPWVWLFGSTEQLPVGEEVAILRHSSSVVHLWLCIFCINCISRPHRTVVNPWPQFKLHQRRLLLHQHR